MDGRPAYTMRLLRYDGYRTNTLMKEKRKSTVKKTLSFALCLILLLCIALPLTAYAGEAEQKVVRVGWYDSSFCYRDAFGRRCGLDYEYQQRISAYTGWTYEYVEDSWSNLFQKLKDGEIDLLSDVSYKPERTEYMLFPELPMGSEAYYIYIASSNREITAENLASFNGTTIGVNEGSVQEDFLKDWTERNGLAITVLPLDVEESESLDMLQRGEIDGYATVFSFSDTANIVPVCRIGASDYFYAVNKRRPDLLAELNKALSGIQDEDPYFNQMISEKRLHTTRTSAFLLPEQEDWLKEHGAVRVGYREDCLPFCKTDRETGKLEGALQDYLNHASNSMRNVDLRFETVPYPSTEEALKAMEAGEIDCVFPVNLSSYDADEMGIRLTNPAMKTGMNAVVRSSDKQDLSMDSEITFAVSAGDLNIESFIKDQYPACTTVTFPDVTTCFEAVSSGEADCILVSSYRIPGAEETLKKYRLFSIPTGEAMQLAFAVDKDNTALYFILNKTAVMTRSEDMDSAIASYMQTDRKVSFSQFLNDNWGGVVAVISAVFLLIIVLLRLRLNAERKLNDQQKMMEEALRRELEQKQKLESAMEMAYRDPLTGVKSKHAYNEAENRMDVRIAEGTVSEFSVAIFDLNDLKHINDTRGHEVGDEQIRDACRQICSVFKRSPVFRIGGDEFTAILEGEDYANQDELLERFEKQVLLNVKQNRAVVACGCSRFVPQQDKSIREVFERADAAMYKDKTMLKSISALGREDKPEEAERRENLEEVPVVHSRRHILIADDIEMNREILGDLLEEDYDIMYAADGVETMETLRSHKDEIALLILDLYMPNMTGKEVLAEMQVDEELMSIPVIVLTVDQDAELECLKLGAMDFIPKPYPDIDIVKARIAKCIELSENRDLIRRTQRDKLTGLFHFDYFIRYVNRYDRYYQETAFDAVVCDIIAFHAVNEQYGRQFGDLVLRSIGMSMNKLARKTGGIACRKEGDLFLLYCQHREDYEQLLKKFLAEVFVDKETANKVRLRFGVYDNAQQEPDIEERFVRAKHAADSAKDDPELICGFYEFKQG